MKKILIILLAFSLTFAMVGCEPVDELLDGPCDKCKVTCPSEIDCGCTSLVACQECKNVCPCPRDVQVTLSNVTQDGNTNKTTTSITLNFTRTITGLSASNVTLGDVPEGVTKKGNLTLQQGSASYKIDIEGFTAGGTMSVTVSVPEGYQLTGSTQTVTIYYYSSVEPPKVVDSELNLEQDGSASKATTLLTLKFNPPVPGLESSDITLGSTESSAAATKGKFTPKDNDGIEYELVVSNVVSGSLRVEVVKAGFEIPAKSITVYSGVNNVKLDLSANGEADVSMTTQLTLLFSSTIPELDADDVIITPNTIKKGTTNAITGGYILTISGFTKTQTITVDIEKEGYVVGSETVEIIYFVPPEATDNALSEGAISALEDAGITIGDIKLPADTIFHNFADSTVAVGTNVIHLAWKEATLPEWDAYVQSYGFTPNPRAVIVITDYHDGITVTGCTQASIMYTPSAGELDMTGLEVPGGTIILELVYATN